MGEMFTLDVPASSRAGSLPQWRGVDRPIHDPPKTLWELARDEAGRGNTKSGQKKPPVNPLRIGNAAN